MTLQEIKRDHLFVEFKPINAIFQGNSWVVAKSLPSDYVQTIVTSPPYFGHREYSDDSKLALQEFGREDEPKQYVQKLVDFFDELKRVLREDGTLWLNLGDTYRKEQLLGIPWRVLWRCKILDGICEVKLSGTNLMPCLPPLRIARQRRMSIYFYSQRALVHKLRKECKPPIISIGYATM